MRVLLAAFKQETSSFNPRPTTRDLFTITKGAEIVERYTGTNTEVAGALDLFAENEIEVIPTYAATSVTSGGPVPAADLDRMIDELLAEIERNKDVDGAYINFHGAMAGEEEPDPEGRVLAGVGNPEFDRERIRTDVPEPTAAERCPRGPGRLREEVLG